MRPRTYFSILSCAAYLLALCSLPLSGAGTITLNISARSPLVPVARALITIDLDSDATGASISYNPAGALAPKVLTLAGANSVDAGNVDNDATKDFLIFKRIGATNTAQLSITLIGKMNAASDLCTLKVPEASTHTINLTTSQNVTSYRANYYTVPSDTCAAAISKGQATRRVKISNTAVAITGGGAHTFLGRNPFDMALVLDKSGSMGSLPPGGGLDSKWTILQQAVANFVSVWGMAEAPPPSVGGGTSPDDKMAVVFFSDAPAPANATGTYISRGVAPNPWQTIINTVNATTFGGSTAMGPGLKAALDSAATATDLTVVLLTDGMQNVDPQVVRNPADAANPAAALQIGSAGGTASLASLGIPILTVGVGAPAGIDGDRLDTLAKQTAGSVKIALDNTGMINGFKDTLVDSLKGNTLSLYSRTVQTLTSGQISTTPVTLTVDKSMKRFIVDLVSLQGGLRQSASVVAIPPGSSTPATPSQVRTNGNGFLDAAFEAPAQGDWQISISRAATSTQPAATYQLSLYSVDESLSYRIAVSNPQAGTGDNLVLNAEVTYDGQPLKGLAGGITAIVQRPGESFGNLLHAAGFDASAPPPDAMTPAQQKADQLLKASGVLGQITPQPVAGTLTLHDDGLNGDLRADDGIYTATFPDTNKAGLYRFAVNLDWTTPLTGHVHRVESTERVLTVTPDSGNSQITATAVAGSPGSFQVSVTPRDKFGNYMGPGYAPVISVSASNGNVAGPPSDAQQTGSYVYRIDNVPGGAEPIVKVVVNGVPLGVVTNPGGSGLPWWWWIVVLIVVILILLWLLLRKK